MELKCRENQIKELEKCHQFKHIDFIEEYFKVIMNNKRSGIAHKNQLFISVIQSKIQNASFKVVEIITTS